jgi:hypothetical protein
MGFAVSGALPPAWLPRDQFEHSVTWLGRQHGVDEAVASGAVPQLMIWARQRADLWRLAFIGRGAGKWLGLRRGDGRLLGAEDGSFGRLDGGIHWDTWRVSLGWVRRAFRDVQLGNEDEFAYWYLGLSLHDVHDLGRLPRFAWLELSFSSIERKLVEFWRSQRPTETVPVHLASVDRAVLGALSVGSLSPRVPDEPRTRPTVATPPPRTRGKGRSRPPYWAAARAVALTWLQTKGVPNPGDGRQAKLELHITNWLDANKHKAGESIIRYRVKEWIEEFRQSNED